MGKNEVTLTLDYFQFTGNPVLAISSQGFYMCQIRKREDSCQSVWIVQFLFFPEVLKKHEYVVCNFVTQIVLNLLLMKFGKSFCSQHAQIGHAVSSGRSR